MIILTGFCATRRRLAAADFSPGISLPAANRRPGRVASTMPTIARTTARISSSLLPDGSLKAWAILRPDQAQPCPVGRLDGLPAASHLCQLREQVVERARDGGDRKQRS